MLFSTRRSGRISSLKLFKWRQFAGASAADAVRLFAAGELLPGLQLLVVEEAVQKVLLRVRAAAAQAALVDGAATG